MFEHQSLVAAKFPKPPITFDVAAAALYSAFDLAEWRPYTTAAGGWLIQGCFIVTLLMLLSRSVADVYFGIVAAGPLLIATVISLFSRHLFFERYFLMIHLFYLICLARLVSRLPGLTIKVTVGIAMIFGMSCLTQSKLTHRDLDARKPGMRGTVAAWESQRKPGERLVVCNPMLYLPARDHSQIRRDILAYGAPDRYPFFQGTAVMEDDEYLTLLQLDQAVERVIWTLDAEEWFSHSWKTHLPAAWREASVERFPEFNMILLLRRYERLEPNSIKCNTEP